VPASDAAILYATQPLWAMLAAAVVLGESFGVRGATGGVLVLVGVLLAVSRPAAEAVRGGKGGGGAPPRPTAPPASS